MKGDGLIKKYSEALNESTIKECLKKNVRSIGYTQKRQNFL